MKLQHHQDKVTLLCFDHNKNKLFFRRINFSFFIIFKIKGPDQLDFEKNFLQNIELLLWEQKKNNS